MELDKKRVLLTGGSSGIGKAIAQVFLKRQANVIVFGRHKPENCSQFYEVDVAKEEQILSALDKVEKIDILINNAGVSMDSGITDTSTETLDTMLNINFKGAFWMSKHSMPKISDSGCIVNISSICGLKGFANLGIYSATKSAIISLTQTLALELAQRKIRVNAIAPGVIDTDIWQKRFGQEAKNVIEEIEKGIPLKRVGRPEEIAHAAIFLCENDFVNGETLVVDGGQSIAGI